MKVLIVEIHLKPGMQEKFLAAIVDDATRSEADEPGCLRFDVLQDEENADIFYLYEVYTDDAAIAAHRETPHLRRFSAALPDLIEGQVSRRLASTVHPAAWR